MSQLTKEDFELILTKRLAPLATKDDVHREVRGGVEELARMVSEGFEDLQRRLDVREIVEATNESSRSSKKPYTLRYKGAVYFFSAFLRFAQ